jgi:hypothetical protein
MPSSAASLFALPRKLTEISFAIKLIRFRVLPSGPTSSPKGSYPVLHSQSRRSAAGQLWSQFLPVERSLNVGF